MLVVYWTNADGSLYIDVWDPQGDWEGTLRNAANCMFEPSDGYWIVPGTYSE